MRLKAPKKKKTGPYTITDKGIVYIVDGTRTTPVVNGKGEFYPSTQSAGKAYKVHSTAITFVIRRGKGTSAGQTWRRASVEECATNGFPPKRGSKGKRSKGPQSLPKQEIKAGLSVVQIKNGKVKLSDRRIPVISDQGEFYTSGREASHALGMKSTAAVAKSLSDGQAVGGRIWRYATNTEVMAHGIKSEVKEQPTLIEVPYKEPPRKHKPTKQGAAQRSKVDAAFYGVRWPDGAVTLRANHGSTWTMTRMSETDIPKEILTETVWVST